MKELIRRGGSPMSLFDDLANMHDEFNKLFELRHPYFKEAEFPKVNVSENETEIKVAAELPGMDEKDVKIDVDEDILTIRGERKQETEEKGRNWHRIEQRYGSFSRAMQLNRPVDISKAKAVFKKGILDITLPKLEKTPPRKNTIEIKGE